MAKEIFHSFDCGDKTHEMAQTVSDALNHDLYGPVRIVENRDGIVALISADSIVLFYPGGEDTQPEILEGYANHHGYSDVNPYEIVRVVSGKTIDVRQMHAEELPWERDFHPGGFCGHTSNQHDQKWEITSDAALPIIRIRKHRDGTWQCPNKRKFLLSFEPRKFYDYNF